MKAEEYLKSCTNKSAISSSLDEVFLIDALDAIKLAYQEKDDEYNGEKKKIENYEQNINPCTINAESLRIGDKVLLFDNVVTIRGIIDDFIYVKEKDKKYPRKYIEPITITDKILYKIGFKLTDNGLFLLTDKNIPYIEFYYNLGTFTIINHENKKEGIHKLHELQHELYDAAILM